MMHKENETIFKWLQRHYITTIIVSTNENIHTTNVLYKLTKETKTWEVKSQDSSSPLVVEKSEVILVKPSKPTSDHSLSLSTIDNDPYLEKIEQTLCVFSPKPDLVNQPKYDPISLLQYALSQALVYYYPFAGRIHRKSDDGRLQLNCTAGDGVPLIRAVAECTLASLDYLENVGDGIYQLVPSYEPGKGCEAYDPLVIQVTKFACGGVTIGVAFSHSVCDGIGVAQFLRAMTELATGKSQPTVMPVWERERLNFNGIEDESEDISKTLGLLKSLHGSSSIATSSYSESTEDMVNEMLNITSEDIMKFKKIIAEEEKITNENNEKNVAITTLEIVAALMWRAKCRALKLNPEGITVFAMSIGIRNVMSLPEGYYGNAVVFTFGVLTAKELSESSLSRVVRIIQEMKRAALDKRYVSYHLGMVEARMKEEATYGSSSGGIMTLTDLRHIGLQYDGWGSLVNVVPVPHMTMPYLCVLLPTSKTALGMSGGVRMLVRLPKEAMATFKEEMSAF